MLVGSAGGRKTLNAKALGKKKKALRYIMCLRSPLCADDCAHSMSFISAEQGGRERMLPLVAGYSVSWTSQLEHWHHVHDHAPIKPGVHVISWPTSPSFISAEKKTESQGGVRQQHC